MNAHMHGCGYNRVSTRTKVYSPRKHFPESEVAAEVLGGCLKALEFEKTAYTKEY